MNAPAQIPTNAASVMADSQLIACDAIVEFAGILCCESAALLAASAACDVSAVEARLWTCRRVLTAAIATWREAVPAPPKDTRGPA